MVLDLVGQMHLPGITRHRLLGADAMHDVLRQGWGVRVGGWVVGGGRAQQAMRQCGIYILLLKSASAEGKQCKSWAFGGLSELWREGQGQSS